MSIILDKVNYVYSEGTAYQIQALKDVNLTIEDGQFIGVIGHTGSGKSTLIQHLNGLMKATSGTIYFHGQDIYEDDFDLRELRNRVGLVFQYPEHQLFETTIFDDVCFGPKNQNLPPEECEKRAKEALEHVGLDESYYAKSPFELSGGQRQRVMIAMAVANHPKVLIADEPTTALDVTVQKQILELILRLKEKFGMAVVFISHDLNVVKKIANRVLVMRQGVIVEQGSVGNIFNAPIHPYTKELLAAFHHTAPRQDFKSRKLMEARDISVSFVLKKNLWGKPVTKIDAVRNVSLALYEGKTLGVVGESGSGKTTLGMCLADLTKYRGEILTAKSVHIRNEKDFRKNVQIVFQDPYNSLNPRMTIEEIVGEGLAVHFPRLSGEETTAKVKKVLTEVGLSGEEILAKYPHEFSGGQRQRIAIARALAVEPKIMILDEPTSALDVTVQAEIIALLKRIQNATGIAYLFISHDMRAVREISHEVAVMRRGRIVEQGTADEIFNNPQTPYARELIGAALN